MLISACLLLQSKNNYISLRNHKPLLSLSVILDIALLSISFFSILVATSSGNFFGLNSAFGFCLIGSTILLCTVLSILVVSILKIRIYKEENKHQCLELSNKLQAHDFTIKKLRDIIEDLKLQRKELLLILDNR